MVSDPSPIVTSPTRMTVSSGWNSREVSLKGRLVRVTEATPGRTERRSARRSTQAPPSPRTATTTAAPPRFSWGVRPSSRMAPRAAFSCSSVASTDITTNIWPRLASRPPSRLPRPTPGPGHHPPPHKRKSRGPAASAHTRHFRPPELTLRGGSCRARKVEVVRSHGRATIPAARGRCQRDHRREWLHAAPASCCTAGSRSAVGAPDSRPLARSPAFCCLTGSRSAVGAPDSRPLARSPAFCCMAGSRVVRSPAVRRPPATFPLRCSPGHVAPRLPTAARPPPSAPTRWWRPAPADNPRRSRDPHRPCRRSLLECAAPWPGEVA